MSTMSYLGYSIRRKTKSDVYPKSELIETYPYSNPLKGLMIRDFTLPPVLFISIKNPYPKGREVNQQRIKNIFPGHHLEE